MMTFEQIKQKARDAIRAGRDGVSEIAEAFRATLLSGKTEEISSSASIINSSSSDDEDLGDYAEVTKFETIKTLIAALLTDLNEYDNNFNQAIAQQKKVLFAQGAFPKLKEGTESDDIAFDEKVKNVRQFVDACNNVTNKNVITQEKMRSNTLTMIQKMLNQLSEFSTEISKDNAQKQIPVLEILVEAFFSTVAKLFKDEIYSDAFLKAAAKNELVATATQPFTALIASLNKYEKNSKTISDEEKLLIEQGLEFQFQQSIEKWLATKRELFSTKTSVAVPSLAHLQSIIDRSKTEIDAAITKYRSAFKVTAPRPQQKTQARVDLVTKEKEEAARITAQKAPLNLTESGSTAINANKPDTQATETKVNSNTLRKRPEIVHSVNETSTQKPKAVSTGMQFNAATVAALTNRVVKPSAQNDLSEGASSQRAPVKPSEIKIPELKAKPSTTVKPEQNPSLFEEAAQRKTALRPLASSATAKPVSSETKAQNDARIDQLAAMEMALSKSRSDDDVTSSRRPPVVSAKPAAPATQPKPVTTKPAETLAVSSDALAIAPKKALKPLPPRAASVAGTATVFGASATTAAANAQQQAKHVTPPAKLPKPGANKP